MCWPVDMRVEGDLQQSQRQPVRLAMARVLCDSQMLPQAASFPFPENRLDRPGLFLAGLSIRPQLFFFSLVDFSWYDKGEGKPLY